MNSLEFINLEIAITKTRLKEHNKFAQTQLAIKDEKRLKQLQQIKTEFEAWEVVKNKIFIKKGSIDYANINIKDWNHHLTKDQYQKLNKVLEVNNHDT